MRARTTIFFVVIAISLATFVWIVDHTKSPLAAGGEGQHLVLMTPSEVDWLEIENGDNRIEISRIQTGWQLNHPVVDQADAPMIERLFEDIESLHPIAVISGLGKGETKKKKLREFGLQKSRLILRWRANGRRTEIQFGEQAPVENTGYVRVTGEEPVFVVSSRLAKIVSKPIYDFRDHRLTNFLPDQIDRIVLHSRGGEMELTRVQTQWQIVRPVKTRADETLVNSLINRVIDAKIVDFVNRENPSLSAADLVTTSFFSGNDRLDLTCAGAAPGKNLDYLRVSSRPSVVVVPGGICEHLILRPDELRDRKILRLNADLVDRIHVRSFGLPELNLVRRENRWIVPEARDVEVSSDAVRAFIELLNRSDVRKFVIDTTTDLAAYGLDHPRLQVTFSSFASENTAESSAGEVALATLSIGQKVGDDSFARNEQEPGIFSVSQTIVDEIPIRPETIQSLDITNLDRASLVSVMIQDTTGEIRLLRNPSNQWSADGSPVDEVVLQSFLNTIAHLRATSWLGAVYNGQKNLKLSMLLDTGKTVVARLGIREGDPGMFGTIDGRPGVFLLDAKTREILTKPLKTN